MHIRITAEQLLILSLTGIPILLKATALDLAG
jgi:hypothetical protein